MTQPLDPQYIPHDSDQDYQTTYLACLHQMMMGSIEAEALLWKESLAVEGLHNKFVDDLDSQIAVDMHSLDLDIGTAIETTVGSDESSFDFFSYQSTVSSRSREMMRTSRTLKKSLNDLLNNN